MSLKTKIILIPFIFSLILISCKEEPTDLGNTLLSSSDKIKVDTLSDLPVVSSSVFRKTINTSETGALVIGAANGFECYSVLRFLSIPDSLSGSDVIEANLYFRPATYRMGDNGDQFNFSAYKVSTDWTMSNLDTLISQNSFSWETASQGDFNKSVVDTEYLFIKLNNNLVKDWLDTTKKTLNRGIVLAPNGQTKSIRSFYSANYTSLSPYMKIVRNKGTYVDTITLAYIEDTYFAKNNNSFNNKNYIYTQAGVSYRSRLYFDISRLPKFAFISNATLTLTVDKDQSKFGTGYIDSLSVSLVENPVKDSTSSRLIISKTFIDNGGSKYQFDITPVVQSWVTKKDNNGLDILAMSELTGVDLFAIYSQFVTDKNKTPKLNITYFTAPK